MPWQETNTPLLNELIRHKPLGLVSDMDGTLSPIVPSPDDAYVTERARSLLGALAERLPLVALVSGRGAGDLRQRAGLPQLVYVGNHGMERWQDDAVIVRPEAEAYRPALEAALDELRLFIWPDMLLEDKGVTASVHYRQTVDTDAARDMLEPLVERVAAEHGLRAPAGRMIFELRPPVEIDKGTAFRELVREYGLRGAVFIGDDTTDADAMLVAKRLRESGECYTVAVGVDAPGTPDSVREAADLLVPGVEGVEDFLDWLLSAASASDT